MVNGTIIGATHSTQTVAYRTTDGGRRTADIHYTKLIPRWEGPDGHLFTVPGSVQYGSDVHNRAGFRDRWRPAETPGTRIPSDAYQYYILAETFTQEICAGQDANALAKALKDAGHLVIKEQGRYSYKKTIDGVGRPRIYDILPSIFES